MFLGKEIEHWDKFVEKVKTSLYPAGSWVTLEL